MMIEQIINQLRVERHAKRWTLDDLADKSGISKKHICNIENGKTRPSMDTLGKIAEALGIKISVQLTGGTVAAADQLMAAGE